MKRSVLRATLSSFVISIVACGTSTIDEIKDAVDTADGVPRKEITRGTTGVNAFFNNPRYGSIPAQYSEITSTLGIRHLRVLMSWNDAVQPSPNASPNFGLYDEIVSGAPAGADLLVILTGTPSWMEDRSNWVDGNPRKTFVDRWVDRVVRRYGGSNRISGWQIWNEPNFPGRSDNTIMGFETNPSNFIELMGFAFGRCKDLAPGKLVVNGATTAINQNFPGTLDYNRALRDGGMSAFTDIFAIHYYGRQYENVVRPGGVQDFLQSIAEPIWVTESGAQGVSEQLEYVEQTWPYLSEKVPGIERFYYYQMYDTDDPANTYGLRNGSTSAPLSDLYLYLRDGIR